MAAPQLAVDGRSRRGRLLLDRDARTTIHVACHDADRTELAVAVLPGPSRLDPWCAAHGVGEAIVGGYFVRPHGTPLGEVRTHGIAREHVPFDPPWIAYDPAADSEGFVAGAHQFDPSPADGRHPRAALGLAQGRILAAACDGRSRHDAGLTLLELARLMVALGCREALNLDGGGSTALVSGGRLQNLPRSGYELPEPGGRPISTALVLRPRS